MSKEKKTASGGIARRSIVLVAGAVILAAGLGGWILATANGDSTLLTADPGNATQVAQGKALYGTYCASCHGTDLQGQPNWRQRDARGVLPAPPHDKTGHTWHHPDQQLFAITKQGVAAFAPPGYVSNMAGYGDRLSDAEIWSILAYIKSQWPADIQQMQAARNGGS